MTNETIATGARARRPAGTRQTSPSGQLQFHTIAEVAEMLTVSQRTVRRWIKRGELVAHHFGSAVRIAGSDLNAFVVLRRGV
jgi:excisionase family DNA binding protein